MLLTVLLGTLLLAQNTACSGADPAIVSVRVASSTVQAGNTIYHLTGIVQNVGKVKQASNVLQFVDIDIGGTGKVDSRGVPPLAPGQRYTFGYDFKRSSGAGLGSSRLHFKLDFRQPSPPGSQDCNPANDEFTLRV
ncbi:MAG TPA: hypothetical protein VMD07_03090 [Candidatus Acidoferrales bacterium]|nr:hypothetical protein [Candidatus Acidoferrales bacterium]